MTEYPLITVVLPIYNVRQYLNRCVQSVVNQSYANLEIIMIDDGATDGSYDLCDEWAAKDRRICVIHKENSGLGMARNTGIENAHGQYICFFDSDDYIRLDTIERAVSAARFYSSEIVIWGSGGVNQKGELYVTNIPNVPKEFFYGDEIQDWLLPNLVAYDPNGEKTNLRMSAWSMMYSMDLINRAGWRFVSERQIISEDVYSLLDLFASVKSAFVIQDYLYFYCINDKSLTNVYRPDRYQKIKIFYLKSVELCKERKYSVEIISRVSGPYLAFTIAALKQESKHMAFGNTQIRDIINDDVFCKTIHTFKYRGTLKRRFFFWAAKKKMMLLCEALLYFQTKQ